MIAQNIFNGLSDHLSGPEIDGGLSRRNLEPRQRHLPNAFATGDHDIRMLFAVFSMSDFRVISVLAERHNGADLGPVGDIRVVAGVLDYGGCGLAVGNHLAAMDRNPDAVSGQKQNIHGIRISASNNSCQCGFGCGCRGGSSGKAGFKCSCLC